MENNEKDLDDLMKIKNIPNKYRLGTKIVENQQKKSKLELEKRLDTLEKKMDKQFRIIEQQLKQLINQRARDAHRTED